MRIIAYKLFRELKSGEITSLFINKSRKLPLNEWMDSENYPTKGFAERQGWHCTAEPNAPHLKMVLKNGEKRVWKKVVIEDYTEFKRPENQGGLWFLAKRMMIVDEIHKEHLEMFCRQLNHMVNKAENVVSSFENIKFPAIRKAFQKSIKKIND